MFKFNRSGYALKNTFTEELEKTREHNLYLIKHLMEAFTKIVQLFKSLTIFAKRSIVYLVRSKTPSENTLKSTSDKMI